MAQLQQRGGVVVYELPERPKVGEVVMLPDGRRVKVRDIGIPWVLPPKKVCTDPKCPWHGRLRVRLKTMELVVAKFRAQKMAAAWHFWLHYDSKYKRYERRRRKIHVYVPPCIDVKEGDRIIVAETRPLAKTVAWVVIGKAEDVVRWTTPRERLGEQQTS